MKSFKQEQNNYKLPTNSIHMLSYLPAGVLTSLTADLQLNVTTTHVLEAFAFYFEFAK